MNDALNDIQTELSAMAKARKEREDSSATAAVAVGMAAFPLVATGLFAMVFWKSFVVMKLWNWYLVTGVGLQPIHQIYAFGLCILWTLLQSSAYRAPDKAVPKWTHFVRPFTGPLVSLVVGWIGTFFI